MKPGVIGKDIFLSPEGGETKKIISSVRRGGLLSITIITPGYTRGYNCSDPSDLAQIGPKL